MSPDALIQKIIEKLKKYPDTFYEAKEKHISVVPKGADTFPVALSVDPAAYRISALGWHEQFKNEEDALNCFAFLLSEEARIKVESRGNFPYKWTLENKKDGAWKHDSSVGLLIFPFWKTKNVCYYQNRLIAAR